jgi:hypothetical protein
MDQVLHNGEPALSSCPSEYGSGLTCEGCHTAEERDELTGSFNHLVGAGDDSRRHNDTQTFGDLEVDG